MAVMLTDELVETLKATAEREAWDDNIEDFNPYDLSGGNFDDAFTGGYSSGEINAARSLLTALGISWE